MDQRQRIVDAGRQMLHSGLTVETWGNLSLRDPETGLVYLTPSGMAYDSLVPDDVVVVKADGTVFSGSRKPTIEKGMHLAIYAARPDVLAVIHTHPVESTVFGVLHRPIPVVTDEAAQIFGREVRVTNYALPGSAEIAEEVVKALGDCCACLVANHGAVCVGSDFAKAFRACRVLEMTAEIYRKALMLGEPVPIAEKDTAFMKDFMDHRYGQGR